MRIHAAPVFALCLASMAYGQIPAPPEPPPAPPAIPLPAPPPQPPAPSPPAGAASADAGSVKAMLDGWAAVKVTYGQINEDPSSGKVSIADLVLEPVRPGVAGRIEIAALEGEGVRPEDIARIFDASRYGAADDAFRSLADRLSLRGVKLIVDGETAVKVDLIDLERWRMKPFGFRPGGDDFLSQFVSAELAPAQIFGHALDSVIVGRVVFEGIETKFVQPAIAQLPGSQAVDGVNRYGRMEIEGIERGVFGRMTAHDIRSSVTTPEMQFETSVTETRWDRIDLSKAAPWLMKAEMPPITREPLLYFGESCATDYEVKVVNLGTLTFPEICVNPVEFVWLLPRHIKVDAKGIYAPALGGRLEPSPHVAKYFDRPLAIALRFEGAYDPDAGEVTVSHYGLGLESFGAVDFGFVLKGLELDGLQTLADAAAERMFLKSGFLKVEDDGGLDKIFEMVAAEMAGSDGAAQSPAALRIQARSGVDFMIGALGAAPEALQMGDALKAFLDKGGDIELRVDPPTPLSFKALDALESKAPGEILKALGVSAQHAP